jgi:hypothetical protein
VELVFIVIYQYKAYISGQGNIFMLALFTARDAGILLLCHHVLKSMNEVTVLDTYSNHLNEETLVSTPKVQRLFHHVVDTLMAILVFGSMLNIINQYLHIGDIQGAEEIGMAIMVAVFRIVYYVITESILKTTPGKLLTGSRVVAFDGTPPTTSKILTRTLCRFIPFEALSFASQHGWHDRLSETAVVKEVRTGIRGAWYFWTVPALVAVAFLGYLGYLKLEQYQAYRARKHAFELKATMIAHEVKHISTSHYFSIRHSEQDNGGRVTYLKIDSVFGDRVRVHVLVAYQPDRVTELPSRFKDDSLSVRTTIALADLKRMVPTDYMSESEERILRYAEATESAFINEPSKYLIKDYFIAGSPDISVSMNGLMGFSNVQYSGDDYNTIIIGFQNCGWGGRVIKINNLRGNIQWTTDLPLDFNASYDGSSNCSPFSLTGIQTSSRVSEFELITEDAFGRQKTYLVQQNAHSASLQEVPGTGLDK